LNFEFRIAEVAVFQDGVGLVVQCVDKISPGKQEVTDLHCRKKQKKF
jgi:hypothetical protein